MNTIRIISRHNTLAEAVASLNPDVSYNARTAAEYIREADSPCNRAKELGIGATERAYVVEENGKPDILHIYTAQGIRFAKHFSPFAGCLSNSDLTVWAVNDREGCFTKTGAAFSNDKTGRSVLAECCKACSEIVTLH